MAGAAVQNAQVSGVAGATSIAITLGGAITAGNAAVAFVEFTGGAASGDTLTNGTDALTLQGAIVNDAGTRMARYAKVNCTGGGSTTFTWANATSLTNRAMWLIECSGIDTSAAVVGGGNPAASAPGAGTDAITTGSIANSAGLTAFHIGIGCDYAADTITIVKGTGETQVGSAGWTDVFGTVSAGAIIEFKAGIAASASDALTYTGGYGGHTYKAASIMLKEAAVGAATLSSATPSGTLGTPTTATLGATTNQTSGTFYGVVDSAGNISGVTAAQVKAGQNNVGAAPVASGNSAVSNTSPSVGMSGLVANTLYSYAVVQNNGGGDSNVLTGTFTTAIATSNLDIRKFGPQGFLKTLLTM